MILQTNFRPISTGSGLFCEEKTEPEDVKESRPVQTYPVETSIKYIKSAGNRNLIPLIKSIIYLIIE